MANFLKKMLGINKEVFLKRDSSDAVRLMKARPLPELFGGGGALDRDRPCTKSKNFNVLKIFLFPI